MMCLCDSESFFPYFLFKVGSSYSAEDIALQTVKYGAKQVICTYRTNAMGFKWPPEISERPIFTHVEEKTVHFSGNLKSGFSTTMKKVLKVFRLYFQMEVLLR